MTVANPVMSTNQSGGNGLIGLFLSTVTRGVTAVIGIYPQSTVSGEELMPPPL